MSLEACACPYQEPFRVVVAYAGATANASDMFSWSTNIIPCFPVPAFVVEESSRSCTFRFGAIVTSFVASRYLIQYV